MTRWLRTEHCPIAISQACGLFGLTRDAWYKSLYRLERRKMEDVLVANEVRRIRAELPGCGGRKLLHMMQGFIKVHGLKLGRDKFFDILRTNDLLVKRRKRRRVTTNSNHPLRKYANLVTDIDLSGPNQVWVSDITYILAGSTFDYLSLITDAWSRKILGWALERTLAATGPVRALKQALKQWDGRSGLYHHSDRGIQYCCHNYTGLLRSNKIKISMTQSGDPGENALAERVHGTLKGEFLDYWFHGNHKAALGAVARAINNYNEVRPHESLGYRTPSEVHAG